MKTTEEDFWDLFDTTKPIIGMLHLAPLPGSPNYQGEGLDSVIERGLAEAESLVSGGVDAIQIENFNDPTYYPNEAPPETIASISIVAKELRKEFPEIPMGICLLADPKASIAVAHSVQAQFVRATFFTEASVDVSGIVKRKPHDILRYRKFLDPEIKLFADVHIKHSAPLADRPIEESAYDAAYFQSDAVIISGKHTGKPTADDDVSRVREVLPDFPILVGSGACEENIQSLFKFASGAIVGSSLKKDGEPQNRVDCDRVESFMDSVEEIRTKD